MCKKFYNTAAIYLATCLRAKLHINSIFWNLVLVLPHYISTTNSISHVQGVTAKLTMVWRRPLIHKADKVLSSFFNDVLERNKKARNVTKLED